MAKTFAGRLDEIQGRAEHILLPLTFRAKGRRFIRERNGLTQIVGFGMVGAWSVSHGAFGIECGVYIPEVHGLEFRPAKSPDTPDCAIRVRVDELAGVADLGWHLNGDIGELASDVMARVQTLAVPFLEAFDSREKIIGDWVSFADRYLPSEGRARIVVAVVLARLQRTVEATTLLTEQPRTASSRCKARTLRARPRRQTRLACVAG